MRKLTSLFPILTQQSATIKHSQKIDKRFLTSTQIFSTCLTQFNKTNNRLFQLPRKTLFTNIQRSFSNLAVTNKHIIAIKVDKRPSHYECALMSQHVYKGSELNKGDVLPIEFDWQVEEVIHGDAGFFAAIYTNAERNQVAVAYRGTKNLAGWIEDFKGIVLGQADTPQKRLAFFTAEKAKQHALSKKAQLTFTGHSLGAYLAELSIFYIQAHLTSGFINNDYDIRHYVSAVTFESPGSQDIMEQLQSQLPHEKRDLRTFDITEYVSYPNIINTWNQHVGTLYSLEPKIIEPSFWKQLTGKELRSIHSIDNIVDIFVSSPGYCAARTYLSHWPQGMQRRYFFEQVEFDHDKKQYIWKNNFQTLMDQFTLTMNGHYTYDHALSTWNILPLRHISFAMQEWLLKFYTQLKQCDEQQLHQVKQAWQKNGIEPYIIGYLVSSQLLKRGIGQTSLYLKMIEQDVSISEIKTTDQFRETLTQWLSNKTNQVKAIQLLTALHHTLLPPNPFNVKTSGSVEAVLLESGAKMSSTARIDHARINTLAVNIPFDTDEKNVQKFQQMTSQFMDNIAQSGLRVRAIGIEQGAIMKGSIGSIDVSAVKFEVGNRNINNQEKLETSLANIIIPSAKNKIEIPSKAEANVQAPQVTQNTFETQSLQEKKSSQEIIATAGSGHHFYGNVTIMGAVYHHQPPFFHQNNVVESLFSFQKTQHRDIIFENCNQENHDEFVSYMSNNKDISLTKNRENSFVEKIIKEGRLTSDENKRYNVPPISSSQEKRRNIFVPEDRNVDVGTGNKSRWQILQAMYAYFDESMSEESLFKGQALIDTHDYRVLKGEGGVGKTMLVKRFAEERRKDYQLIRWIDANDSLENQFSLFLKEVFGIDEQLFAAKHTALDVVTSVYASLAKVDRWLLIFDNVENAAVIEAYKPEKFAEKFVSIQTHATPRRHCLITSRHPDWEGTHVTKVGGFTLKEFQGYARRFFEKTDYPDDVLEQLAHAMQFHPLGLIHVIHYLDNYRRKHDKLLPIFEYLNNLAILSEPIVSDRYLKPSEYGWDRYAVNTLKAISLSVQLLIETTKFTNIDADLSSRLMQHILQCLAYVQRTDVPIKLIQAIVSCLGKLPEQYVDQIAKDIIQILVTYKIIDCDHTYQRIVIHQLMQRSLQFKQFEDTTEESFTLLLQALDRRFDYDPEVLTSLTNKDYRRWITQIEALLEQTIPVSQEGNLATPWILKLYVKLGQYYVFEARNYVRSRHWLQRAEAQVDSLSDPEKRQGTKAKIYGALALSYEKQLLIDEGQEYNKLSLALWNEQKEKLSHLLSIEAMIQKLELDFTDNVKAETILPTLMQCANCLTDYSGDHSTLAYKYIFIRTQYLNIQCYLQQKQVVKAQECIEKIAEDIENLLPETHHFFITLLDYRIQVYEQSSQLEQMKIYSKRVIALADNYVDLWSIEQRYFYRDRLITHGQTELAQQMSQDICDRLNQHRELLNQQNYQGWSILHLAAHYKDIQTVKWLIDQGYSIDESNNFRAVTPLYLAVQAGDSEVVALLLKKGAKVNHTQKYGWTSLNAAAHGGREAVCQLLLASGASVNQANNNGYTPLMSAASQGHEAVCKLLLAHGAAVNQANNNGWTPLMSTASQGYEAVCKLLLDRGAAVNQASNTGYTPLMSAASQGHEAVCRLLLVHEAAVNQVDNTGWTPLMSAASQGHEAVCRLLLAHGAAVNQANNTGWTSLMSAATQGHEAVCKLLLDHGAAVNQVDNNGYTPLLNAAYQGHEAVCKLLLDRGAAVNQVDNIGWTPLISAATQGHAAVCKLLLDRGEDVNQVDNNGYTPLMIAATQGHETVCKLLLGHHADIKKVDENGLTAIHYVSWNRQIGCLKLLSDKININEKGHDEITPLQLAILDGCSLEIISHLVKMGADLTVKLQGLSVGTLAQLRGVQEQIDFFETQGCIFNPEELRHCSPSQFIFQEAAYKTLLTNFQTMGGDLSAPGENGETWLIAAIKQRKIEIIKILLEMGIDPDIENAKKETLLSVARSQGLEEIVNGLLEKIKSDNTDNLSESNPKFIKVEPLELSTENLTFKSLNPISVNNNPHLFLAASTTTTESQPSQRVNVSVRPRWPTELS